MTSLVLMFKKSLSIDCLLTVSQLYNLKILFNHKTVNYIRSWTDYEYRPMYAINIGMYSLLPEYHFYIFCVREDAHEGYVRKTLLALLHANSVSPNVPFVSVFCFAAVSHRVVMEMSWILTSYLNPIKSRERRRKARWWQI